MTYPHFSNGQALLDSGQFDHSPFEVPIEVIQNGLLWLLADPHFHTLKTLLQEDFSSVNELRGELVSGNIKLSSAAIGQVLDEIDRLVDDYRKGISFT